MNLSETFSLLRSGLLSLLAVSLATGTEPAGPESPDQLENRARELWVAGDFEGAKSQYEAAIALDPENPRRPFGLGGLLMSRGYSSLSSGDESGAVLWLQEAETRFLQAIELAETAPDATDVAGQASFQLGEIAFHARRDRDRATEWYEQAFHFLPGDLRIKTALLASGGQITSPEPGEKPTTGAVPSPSPPAITIGAANSILIGGHRLRLSSEAVNENVAIREYLPPGQTIRDWSVLFAQRQHHQFVQPAQYASILAETAARNGGIVVSTATGPGNSATIAFVIHAPTAQMSEVNAWRFFVRNGQLISQQYAERITGTNHDEIALRLVRAKSPEWIRGLQLQRPVAMNSLTEPSTPPMSAFGPQGNTAP